MIRVRVQAEDFNPGEELAALERLAVGAVSSFTGIVRGEAGVATMTLEHYPGMTERALIALVDEARVRWVLAGAIVIHRFGALCAGDRIVFVATASAHRAAALEACAFLIDRLKTDAPFWKKEIGADGSERWVDARSSDDAAAARWR
jgi:molybdopterin synthase catalytic subunit